MSKEESAISIEEELEIIHECEEAGFSQETTEAILEGYKYPNRRRQFNTVDELWAWLESDEDEEDDDAEN